MTGTLNRTAAGTCAGLLGALAVGALWTGCTESGAGSSDTLAFATSGHGTPARAPSRFGARNGYSFGAHGVPGGHGFCGHGGRVCAGPGGSKGTGGAGGAAGPGGMSGGAGGAGGVGAAGGVGGAGGAAPMICSGTPPASALITDFSDAVVGTTGITFGTPPNLGGGTFTYAATGLTAPALSLVPAGATGHALQVVANPGLATDPSNNWSGFGLGFDMCVDASAYTGVEFTIAGTVGNCGLTFAAQFSEDNSVTDDPNFGSCAAGASCFPPSSTQPILAGTTIVDFSQVFGGSPLPTVDAHALTGVQWQFNAPTDGVSVCSANFTISNITFVNDGSGGMSGGGGGRGGGGRAGAGGGSTGPITCIGSAPSTPLITGSTATPAGGTFTFNSPDLAAPQLTPALACDGSIQSLQVSATPGTTTDPMNAFSGFGFYFAAPSCANVTAYDAVEFTIIGDLGTCGLNVFVVTNEDSTIANGGTCPDAGSCVSPFSGSLGKGKHIVRFKDLAGGIPDPTVDPTAVNGVGWTLNVPTDGVTAPCKANFTVSNVAFVNE
jgi:hypothetical protein